MTFSSLISACGRGKEWQRALHLLELAVESLSLDRKPAFQAVFCLFSEFCIFTEPRFFAHCGGALVPLC